MNANNVRREAVLQGTDPVSSAIVARLAQHGWVIDAILRNVAQKRYPPHVATVRVEPGDFDRYWIHGEYWSEGHNVLSASSMMISSPDAIEAAVQAFVAKAEHCINQSFAVRHLG